MTPFKVNTHRLDPYKTFKFRVLWEGSTAPVAGVSKVGALKKTTEVVEFREGNNPNTVLKSPGQTKYEPITLERGVTLDGDFDEWASKVWNIGTSFGAETSLKSFRRNITIEVYNEAGQLALAYEVYRCWVSEYQALPELDASANAVAIQILTLQNEGWRQLEVPELDEPSFE
jgi:phage tail-like protein